MKITAKQAKELGIVNEQPKKRQRATVKPADGLLFKAACEAHGIPEPVPEFWFAHPRRFRFDWVWINERVALEIQGALFSGGRHVRGAALLEEYEKLNLACISGYGVIFCIPQQVNDGSIFPVIRRALEARKL